MAQCSKSTGRKRNPQNKERAAFTTPVLIGSSPRQRSILPDRLSIRPGLVALLRASDRSRLQAKAIQDVQDDLASGHPMDRVICGDVGFGKTEVALRAAAAVALSGIVTTRSGVR
jgi:hypothetical protein